MEEKRYIVDSIEGEYAYLKDTVATESEKLFIAMALLPSGVDVGSVLEYVNFEFSIVV